jgi:hypothetical protein
MIANIPGVQTPVYEQNKPVTVLDPIALSITKCYWADELEKNGLENVPQQFRAEQRHLFVSKAKTKFLVIEVVAINTGQQPAEWNRFVPPIFSLENSTGSVYSPEGDEITGGSFSSLILSSRGILNPGRSLGGKVVFDVSPSDYTLNFALASEMQGAIFRANRTSFKWRLVPTEKP